MATVKHIRGDTWQRAWIITDAAGDVVSLVGASVRLQVRAEDDSLAFEATDANGRLTVNTTTARIDLIAPAAQMELSVGAYGFDLEVTFANGIRTTYEQSTLVIAKDFSRD